MTFYVEGRTAHELMTTDKLFKKRRVDKTEEIDTSHKIIQKRINLPENNNAELVKHSYQQVENFVADKHAVFAEQIMTSPVITLSPDSTVEQAFKLFDKYKFRHVPVTTSDYKLLGIISDRDILRILGSTSEENSNSKINDVMISEVLTASRKTDIRYITRLFVENRIGSMPVMDERKLVGMITRSDILKAVLNHYEIELWV